MKREGCVASPDGLRERASLPGTGGGMVSTLESALSSNTTGSWPWSHWHWSPRMQYPFSAQTKLQYSQVRRGLVVGARAVTPQTNHVG